MTAPTWPEVLTGLINGHDLDQASAEWAMSQILGGAATPVQIAGFAVALRAKGETVDEISGIAAGMLRHALPLEVNTDAVDVVGSGGDRSNTVNISTMAAIVAAAAGARVVKHGNRSASAMCGAADVLEALGVNIDAAPEKQAAVLDQVGIIFLFASKYHSSLRHAATTRRELGVQTTFNILGPLTNPGRPSAQAVGIASREMAPKVAGVLAGRGNRGMVFHGSDGLDELTTTTTSLVWLFREGRLVETELDPTQLGIAPANLDHLVGGPPAHNAQVVRDLLAGATGPIRDIVCLNAAAGLLAYRGPDLDGALVEQMQDCYRVVGEAIDSGAGARLLDTWVAASNA